MTLQSMSAFGKSECVKGMTSILDSFQWLEENAKEVELGPESRTPKTFIPREIYSRYLKSTLKKEASQSKKVDFREMHDEAVEARVLDDSAVQVHPTTRRDSDGSVAEGVEACRLSQT